MAKPTPVPMLCIYRVKKGKDAEFQALLGKHWATMRKAGLASPEPEKVWRGRTKDGQGMFIEMFEWADQSSSDLAHQMPEIMQVWEPMGAIADDMQFIEIERVSV